VAQKALNRKLLNQRDLIKVSCPANGSISTALSSLLYIGVKLERIFETNPLVHRHHGLPL
jgi:hypothetical protein